MEDCVILFYRWYQNPPRYLNTLLIQNYKNACICIYISLLDCAEAGWVDGIKSVFTVFILVYFYTYLLPVRFLQSTPEPLLLLKITWRGRCGLVKTCRLSRLYLYSLHTIILVTESYIMDDWLANNAHRHHGVKGANYFWNSLHVGYSRLINYCITPTLNVQMWSLLWWPMRHKYVVLG